MPINARYSTAVMGLAQLLYLGLGTPTPSPQSRGGGAFVGLRKRNDPTPPLRVHPLQKWANPQGL